MRFANTKRRPCRAFKHCLPDPAMVVFLALPRFQNDPRPLPHFKVVIRKTKIAFSNAALQIS
jgi:hypothetical protein